MGKCPYCGSENPKYVMYCGRCGSEIPVEARSAPEEPVKVGEAKAPEQPAPPPPEPRPAPPKRRVEMVKCVYCKAEQEDGLLYCPSCGKDPKGPWGPLREPDTQVVHTRLDGDLIHSKSASGGLVTGGILAIIAGLLSLAQGLLYTVSGGMFAEYVGSGALCLCGGLGILFGLGSLAGGIFAIQRKSYALAVAGAVVGMLGVGFIIGFFIGLAALIMIASAKQEFYD